MRNEVAGNEDPPLQAFRSSNPFDEGYQASVLAPRESDANHVPLQLLRRASETVTASILADLEPEKEHLLGERPQPPPRVHGAPYQGLSEGGSYLSIKWVPSYYYFF